MLERARATSLALLGATAAVGLAIVAVALNQGWPLVPGSSIPPVPREEVGEATVVARPAPRAPARPGPSGQPHAHSGRRAAAPPRSPAPAVAAPESSSELVVAQVAPTGGNGGQAGKTPAPPAKPPAPQPTGQQSPAPPAPSPAPKPVASPPSQPVSAATTSTPEAAVSEVPSEESNVPSWSNGKGHAYGRSESWHDDEDEDGDQGSSD